MMHLIRKKIAEGCPVCDAFPYRECVETQGKGMPEPVQFEMDLDDSTIEISCIEYQIMAAVRRLRELKPDHTLVLVVGAVLKYQAAEKQQRPSG
jgi:hypothetical protein